MPFPISTALAILLVILAGLFGGSGQALDEWVIGTFIDWRRDNPGAAWGVIQFTRLGGATFLLIVGGLATAWLLLRRRFRTAISFAVTIIAGRLAIELIKLAVERPRPTLDVHPVATFSHSFPSAHAGNSMITYLALALFLAPLAWRRPAIAAAGALATAIGATRPMLGVHWPSDVVAGWLIGLVVVSLGWRFRLRERSEA